MSSGWVLTAIRKAPATIDCDEGLGSVAIEQSNRRMGLTRGRIFLRQSVQASLHGGKLFVGHDAAAHGLQGL